MFGQDAVPHLQPPEGFGPDDHLGVVPGHEVHVVVLKGQDLPAKDVADGFDMRAGLVDARDNWWGEETTREMTEKGSSANITGLVDGYDTPVRTYEGFEGEYAQDQISYAPWSSKPFELKVPNLEPGPGPR